MLDTFRRDTLPAPFRHANSNAAPLTKRFLTRRLRQITVQPMERPITSPRFRIRCRSCNRMVLTGVERVGDAEAAELRAHLARCRPDLPPSVRDRAHADLGALLARFDVTSG